MIVEAPVSDRGVGVCEKTDTIASLEALIRRVHSAQRIWASASQQQVDKVFRAAAMAANAARIPLARMAAEETGMGVVEDKVIKNHFARSEERRGG